MSDTKTDKTLTEINLDELESASGGCAACGNPAHAGGGAGGLGGARPQPSPTRPPGGQAGALGGLR